MVRASTIAAAPAPPDPALARDAFSLLIMLALLGVVLITCVTLILVLRRHRLAHAARTRRAAPTLDPWSEAGRRLTIPDEPEDADPHLGPPAN